MGNDEGDLLLQIKRSLDLLVKLRLDDCRGERNQKDMILYLSALGCTPTEIAALLGTTANVVNPTLSRARKKKE